MSSSNIINLDDSFEQAEAESGLNNLGIEETGKEESMPTKVVEPSMASTTLQSSSEIMDTSPTTDLTTITTTDGTQETEKSASGNEQSNINTTKSIDSTDKTAEMEQAAGGCEELCIIPDKDRIIAQAEKDALAPTNESILPTEAEGEKYVLSHSTECCEQCGLSRKSKYKIVHGVKTSFICDDLCLGTYKTSMGAKISNLEDRTQEKNSSGGSSSNIVPFYRKCASCNDQIYNGNINVLAWETLEFCNELCLSKYQKLIGSVCAKCSTSVPESCMGKYCVRFGYNIQQFCGSSCLEQYKNGLKVCSYCQKEVTEEGFMAPVTEKSLMKDFCSKECLGKYKELSSNEQPVIEGTCSVCGNCKPTMVLEHGEKRDQFCGDPCFVAFKFVNNVAAGQCNMCHKYFNRIVSPEFNMYYDDALRTFCSKGCQNVYIIANRKIMPCNWCKVKKYNFDMVKCSSGSGSAFLTCSLNCLNNCKISSNKDMSTWTTCDQCFKTKQQLYHLTMSDTSLRSFCSYTCVLGFQAKYPKLPLNVVNEPVPINSPKRYAPTTTKASDPENPTIPIITSVQSLANVNGPATAVNRKRTKQNGVVAQQVTSPPSKTIVKTQIRQQVIVKPPPPIIQRNVATMCKVTMDTKEINTENGALTTETQTDTANEKLVVVPIPVPVYVPLPMAMYSAPYPVPFPFPLPVPIPIFIPTTRNSSKGIMKEIKKIQAKMPSNPLEAELLMMADMVAGDKKDDATDSETDGEVEDTIAETTEAPEFTPEPVEPNTSLGEEVLQIAMNMAAELEEPPVDLEGALAVNTVTASAKSEYNDSISQEHVERRSTRGRGARGSRGRRSTRRSTSHVDITPVDDAPPLEPAEKPDANMCLKYTFGVNAWKQWVATKNAELEHSSSRTKLFKPDILQLTADELNYSLCLFVKEVRKPNGQEYAPDTIYYLCLGVQQYLYENARIDNIFCDSYYEKFTDCLDEVARKFSVLYNDSHYIITRVEEEHLWESKQLGAHSPHVLLSTLMFFNTKHFNLSSVDDHMQLSFSHIMKHWKRNPSQSGNQKSGSRNVLLRFYPPQTSEVTVARKKKVYEQQENEDNPLRCPVKLYEFYLSKCPESVKTRNDVFYLLPERSCVPDSPVWYSTSALPKEALEKMLHRVKMVKEINVALLTS